MDYLRTSIIRVLRFWNYQVINVIDPVAQSIFDALEEEGPKGKFA